MPTDRANYRPAFSITTVNVDGQARLILTGEIDLAAREPLRTAIENAVEADRRLVIDLNQVSFIDSSGIGALARAVIEGCDVSVLQPQPAVRRVLEVSGIDRHIRLVGRDDSDERVHDATT